MNSNKSSCSLSPSFFLALKKTSKEALSTTMGLKKPSNEFHKVNFLAVKKLINATGLLERLEPHNNPSKTL